MLQAQFVFCDVYRTLDGYSIKLIFNSQTPNIRQFFFIAKGKKGDRHYFPSQKCFWFSCRNKITRKHISAFQLYFPIIILSQSLYSYPTNDLNIFFEKECERRILITCRVIKRFLYIRGKNKPHKGLGLPFSIEYSIYILYILQGAIILGTRCHYIRYQMPLY